MFARSKQSLSRLLAFQFGLANHANYFSVDPCVIANHANFCGSKCSRVGLSLINVGKCTNAPMSSLHAAAQRREVFRMDDKPEEIIFTRRGPNLNVGARILVRARRELN